MANEVDDWEGRLAAMASGVRDRPPRKVRPPALPADRDSSLFDAQDDHRTFLAEQCPCDQCDLRQQCAAGQLACERYALFMHGHSASRWRKVPAKPTREAFERHVTGSMDLLP